MRKKSNPTFIIVFILIAIALIIANTYARYTKRIAGDATAAVAKWSFNANGFDIARTDYVTSSQILQGQLAPGTSGTINVDIDVTDCDVAVDYMIVLHTFEGKPTHLIIRDEAGEELEYDSVNDRYTVEGSILLSEHEGLTNSNDDVIKHVQLPFEWPYETVPTAGVEQSELDAIDTNEGQTIEEMPFYITVIGMQQAQSNKAVWNISTTGLGQPQVTTVELADKTNGVIEVVVDATGITSGINYTITLSEIQNGLDIMTFTDEDGHALTKNGDDYVLEGTATQEEIQVNPIITRYIYYTGTNSNQGKLDSYKGARIQLAGNGANEIKTIRGITTLADANDPMLIDVEILAEEVPEEGLNSAGTIYTIKTAKGLSDFRDSVNAGNDYAGITVNQVADIDMSTECSASLGSWTPIGTKEEDGKITYVPFAGTYDGGYHTISNLYEVSNKYERLTLFAEISSSAVIKNLVMKNIYLENTNVDFYYPNVAGIVGDCKGTIERCGVESGNIRVIKEQNKSSWGGATSSGICAAIISNGKVSQCYNKANLYVEVVRNNNSQPEAGGITSYCQNNSTIENCYNTGNQTVVNGNQPFSGGIISDKDSNNQVKIQNCYNIGEVSSVTYRGGIVARHSSGSLDITNCYWETGKGASYGIGRANSNSGATPVDATTLKTYASTLGSAYIADPDNRNNGYPILAWELEVE